MCGKECALHVECMKNINEKIARHDHVLFEEPALCTLAIKTEIKMKSIQRWQWAIVTIMLGQLAAIGTGIYLGFFRLLPAIIKILERTI